MNWRVFIDFDGTIALQDTTDLILEKFAAPEWQDVENLWHAGLIGSRECMARQVAMIKADKQELLDFIDKIEIDKGFKKFLALCGKLHLPVKVVSDGMDFVVAHVLRREGFGDLPIAANALHYQGEGRWSLTSPHAYSHCQAASGTCKCAVSADMPMGRSLLIGDGRSDFCLAGEADFVFAKSSLLQHCRNKALPHIGFSNFAELNGPLARLVKVPYHRIAPQQAEWLVAAQ